MPSILARDRTRNSAPIYIPSKGRAKSRLTARSLDKMACDYKIVIEASEFQDYAETCGASRLLVLDPAYQRGYDSLDGLGLAKSKGPGPARNFAWDHAISYGYSYHWVMDDNIAYFFRLIENQHIPVADGAILFAMENYIDRFQNMAMAGPNYFMFAPRKRKIPPYILNTRIYSCNLIRNDVPFRWQGRYNEDTDLSLRMLKAGWCTIQFNAFLQNKQATQTMKGGNTEEFYRAEGTSLKSGMLKALHPEMVKTIRRFGREHHYVDYRRAFAHLKPRLKPGLQITPGTDEYGMELIHLGAGATLETAI
jgi:hypothetical protein